MATRVNDAPEMVPKYRVIHKSVKHLKNSQQMDYATDHGNSYVDIERNC